MAVDKLVDSTQLDADLTNVANAIRTKGGTSEQMAFPAGFVSAVNAIPTGGSDPGDWTNASKHMTTFTFNDVTLPLPETIILDARSVTESGRVFSFPSNWTTDFGYRHIIVKNSNARKISLESLFMNYYPSGRTDSVSITFEDGLTLPNNKWALYRIGYNSPSPRPVLLGEIDLSLLTDSINLEMHVTVKHIEFVPNTCSLTSAFKFQQSGNSLDNSSLVSIANALKDGIAGTVTFHPTIESNIQAIVGRSDASEGYNKFIADSSGTLTLTDFITNVKGWSLNFTS